MTEPRRAVIAGTQPTTGCGAGEPAGIVIPYSRRKLKVLEGKPLLLQEARVRMVRRPGWGIRSEMYVGSAHDVYRMTSAMAAWDRERLLAIFVDSKNAPVAFEVSGTGGTHSAAIHPASIVRTAAVCAARAVILVHNHPSGDPAPSAEDRQVTPRVGSALELVDIQLLDHVIVGHGRYFSFANEKVPLLRAA